MRKTIVYTLCAAMLCAILCGCGNQSQGRDDPAVGTPVIPNATPMVSPMLTPDPQDGYVDDQDGIMEEDETQDDQATNGTANNGKAVVSPSPKVISMP